MPEDFTTYRQFIATFTDFLTVAIHAILHERRIYPAASFLAARKYNLAVHQNRHPKVCEWINDAVAAIEVELLKGTVDKISVVIYETTNNKPLERFVFDLASFPSVPFADVDTPLSRENEAERTTPILPITDLQEQFRATLSKLCNCRSLLKSIPEGCAFTLAFDMRDDREPPVTHPQPWIPVDPGSIAESAQSSVMPVRTVRAGGMLFEVWIEEALVDDVSEKTDSFAS